MCSIYKYALSTYYVKGCVLSTGQSGKPVRYQPCPWGVYGPARKIEKEQVLIITSCCLMSIVKVILNSFGEMALNK